MMTMLIVDDLEMTREILSIYFEEQFRILEAENGEEAMAILEGSGEDIDVILLDLSMPKMGGKQFLEYRKESKKLFQIPVIVVTASDQAKDELETFELGIDDYITKPFMPEVVDYRIQRVIENRRSLLEAEETAYEYKHKAEIDQFTGLYNKATVEQRINEALKETKSSLCALLVCDLDKFKRVNDTMGHLEGDRVLRRISKIMTKQFRKTDMIGRIGGDEFVVFLREIPARDVVRRLARQLIQEVRENVRYQLPEYLSISVGIAYNNCQPMEYSQLFARADEALLDAKENGKDQFREYGVCQREENIPRELALMCNVSRSNRMVLEEVLEEQFSIMEIGTWEQLQRVCECAKKDIAMVFLDVSEEGDQGEGIISRFEIWQKKCHYPLVAIYQEGNMEQCRNVLRMEISDLCASPLDMAYVKRRVKQLIGKFAFYDKGYLLHREG